MGNRAILGCALARSASAICLRIDYSIGANLHEAGSSMSANCRKSTANKNPYI
jgi:hypothetical protein